MRFTQTSATFSHSYNAAFLRALKSVRFSKQNGNPSSSRLLDAFLSAGPIPQVRDGRGGLLFLIIMVVASTCIFLFALLLNGFEIPWLLVLLLGALSCYHFCVVARQWVFARRIRVAWKNGWIDFYPLLLGSLFCSEEQPKKGKKHYLYATKGLVLAPNGDTRCIEVRAEGISPNRMGAQGVAMARDAEKIRLDAVRNNGWTFWAVVRGMPLDHGSVEHGLSASQVAAGLECVRNAWRLDEVDWPPNSV